VLRYLKVGANVLGGETSGIHLI